MSIEDDDNMVEEPPTTGGGHLDIVDGISHRVTITLFSSSRCVRCHAVRFLLAEKDVPFKTIEVDPQAPPSELGLINEDSSIPTLLDRGLVLYDLRTLLEYLDERYPYPPLMPVDPLSRATIRMALFRVEKEWYEIINRLDIKARKNSKNSTQKEEQDRLRMASILTQAAKLFAAQSYFMSREMTLADIMLTPLLLRLKYHRIKLPAAVTGILERYARKNFERPMFEQSLSQFEQSLDT